MERIMELNLNADNILNGLHDEFVENLTDKSILCHSNKDIICYSNDEEEAEECFNSDSDRYDGDFGDEAGDFTKKYNAFRHNDLGPNSQHKGAIGQHNAEKLADSNADRKRKRIKDRADRATVEQVLDTRTKLVLFRLLQRGTLSNINGCISTGKEANVYHATDGQNNFAVKIYKTSILTFKDRERYVTGEFRYRYGYCKHNPRKMVAVWAEKEMRNLLRMHEAGLPVPKPILLKVDISGKGFEMKSSGQSTENTDLVSEKHENIKVADDVREPNECKEKNMQIHRRKKDETLEQHKMRKQAVKEEKRETRKDKMRKHHTSMERTRLLTSSPKKRDCTDEEALQRRMAKMEEDRARKKTAGVPQTSFNKRALMNESSMTTSMYVPSPVERNRNISNMRRQSTQKVQFHYTLYIYRLRQKCRYGS
uniref:Serine/threonine-protein kinase RIO1 n=1 Tax=Heterorhabditis bacteriophora TaxID=37862 RepID=A0A1I7XNS8_HETBA